MANKMKVASLMLRLDKSGHDVHKVDVTPAEALLLVAEHHANAGGDPISELKVTGEVDREVTDEVNRLKTKYAAKKVDALYQGAIPTLPTDFDQARKLGIGQQLPTGKLSETKG